LFAQLVSKIFNLCGHDPPTSQTDRQTDSRTGQTTCDHKTALCTIVHRAVKTQKKTQQKQDKKKVTAEKKNTNVTLTHDLK